MPVAKRMGVIRGLNGTAVVGRQVSYGDFSWRGRSGWLFRGSGVALSARGVPLMLMGSWNWRPGQMRTGFLAV